MNNRSRQIAKALLNARSNIMVRMETKPNEYGSIWFAYVNKKEIRQHIKLGFRILKPPRAYVYSIDDKLWCTPGIGRY